MAAAAVVVVVVVVMVMVMVVVVVATVFLEDIQRQEQRKQTCPCLLYKNAEYLIQVS